MQVLSWQSVRHLSQLSLLNRVAFVMLFLVPLLSGFLRPVRVSVDKANLVLDATQERFAESAVVEGAGAAMGLWRGLQQSVAGESPSVADTETGEEQSGVSAEEAAQSSDNPDASESSANKSDSNSGSDADRQVGLFFPVGWQDEGNDNQASLPWNIRTPFLPRPWALAFVAALMILIGDTVTQLFCPEIVRQNSLGEHVRKEAKRFATCPSASTLEEARNVLVTNKSGPGVLEREDKIRHRLQNVGSEAVHGSFERDELQQVQIQIVESACTIRYRLANARNRIAALFCLVAYLIAAAFVLKILQEQTGNVLRSAGWLG